MRSPIESAGTGRRRAAFDFAPDPLPPASMVEADIIESDPMAPRRTHEAAAASDTPEDAGSRTDDQDLLRLETVVMTVLAQDPVILDGNGFPALARLAVPAGRLAEGPRNNRFHVVDVAADLSSVGAPVRLHREHYPWVYQDRWARAGRKPSVRARRELLGSREFRAQNVFAIAAHTLALFERHLGRPSRGAPAARICTWCPRHARGQRVLHPRAAGRRLRVAAGVG